MRPGSASIGSSTGVRKRINEKHKHYKHSNHSNNTKHNNHNHSYNHRYDDSEGDTAMNQYQKSKNTGFFGWFNRQLIKMGLKRE